MSPPDEDALEIAKVAAMFAGQLGQVDQQTSSPVSQGGPQGVTQSRRINPEQVYQQFAGQNVQAGNSPQPDQPSISPSPVAVPTETSPPILPEPTQSVPNIPTVPSEQKSALQTSAPRSSIFDEETTAEFKKVLKLASAALALYIKKNK